MRRFMLRAAFEAEDLDDAIDKLADHFHQVALTPEGETPALPWTTTLGPTKFELRPTDEGDDPWFTKP